MPPSLCNMGRRFEHTNGRRRPKTKLNLGEDLIFLVFFGQEKRTDFGRKNFHSGIFVILKCSEFPGPPPPFENPAYATGYDITIGHIFDV